MARQKSKARKRLLSMSRAGRPRWGTAFQQRVVVPTKAKPKARLNTRSLLDLSW